MRRITVTATVALLALVMGGLSASPVAAVGTGAIVGHLYGAGTPNVAIESVPVTVYTAAGGYGGGTYTDNFGAYSITGLAPVTTEFTFRAGRATRGCPSGTSTRRQRNPRR